jgi:hypothetical protein
VTPAPTLPVPVVAMVPAVATRPLPATRWHLFPPPSGPVELRDTPLWRPFPTDAVEPRRSGPPALLLGLIAGLLVAVLLVVLTVRALRSAPQSVAGAGQVTAPPATATPAPPPRQPPPPSRSLPGPVAGVVGSPVNVSGVRLTVLSVGPEARGGASPRLLAVQVLYENTGHGRTEVSPYDWALTDSAGNPYPVVLTGLPTDLPERQLPTGGEARGVIDFSVPASATGLVLHYAAEVGDNTAAVALD